ncbi:MAG: T9SS type A sorting domain-containing protein [Bacteroidales bacterium]|nr:T9SS type A sorting domain-containing protein [Bacteroidales bacterium]
MKIPSFIFLLSQLLPLWALAQPNGYRSIHQEENEKFKKMGNMSRGDYDSLRGFIPVFYDLPNKNSILSRKVFGYHPYWGGSNYLNYQWNLLSDFCYFSYEVDPNTGGPLTIHEWETSPAIDSAIANGVKVHLCITLFSSHGTFFNNPDAEQNLINTAIDLVQARQANGINLDFEAMPSAYGSSFTEFVADLHDQIQLINPNLEISIAAPAVNWSNTFDIPALGYFLDFFMVMCYDYYWNGSSQAGPVSPLYSMVGFYDYNFSKTISYYQSQGIDPAKLVVGVPYYARQWPTEGQYAPSATTGTGVAYTYSYIRNNNSGYYSPENKIREPNSFAPYFAFFNDQWTQCFVDDIYSMGKKFDLVNRRNLGGIGIWALGYDIGYPDFWNLIWSKFTSGNGIVSADTIYDSGGPAFDYYNDENYFYTLTTAENSQIHLAFSQLNIEAGYDSLLIFDGPDNQFPLIGVFSGDTVPLNFIASGHQLTLEFKSDAGITASGWRAVYDTIPVSSIKAYKKSPVFGIYPNPVKNEVKIYISLQLSQLKDLKLLILNAKGQKMKEIDFFTEDRIISIDVSSWPAGIYIANLIMNGNKTDQSKFIVK